MYKTFLTGLLMLTATTVAAVSAVLSKYREWRVPPRPALARIEYLPGTRLDLRSIGTDR